MPDAIELLGLRAYGHHGVLASEARDGQWFLLDVWLHIDLRPAADSDDIADTIHYGDLADELTAAVASTRFALIESLAEHLAQLVLGDRRVRRVRVRVAKPQAPVDADVREIAVVIERPPSERGWPIPGR